MSGDIFKTRRETTLENADISALKDIYDIKIDDGNSAIQRILKFIEQTRNPYLFKVGKTPVKVVFLKKYAHVSIEAELAKLVSSKR